MISFLRWKFGKSAIRLEAVSKPHSAPKSLQAA
jgi:hypothetical protein